MIDDRLTPLDPVEELCLFASKETLARWASPGPVITVVEEIASLGRWGFCTGSGIMGSPLLPHFSKCAGKWLFECTVQKLVLVITCLETNEVLERWQFDIECDKSAKESSAPREKSIKTIQDEIRSVIRQITATVTFLPLLETPCAFDLLVYTDKDLVVPDKWEESGPQIIDQSEEVRLRSFTTSIHKVNSMVAYKRTDSV
ncbi:MAD2 mitotic arrest deficient-like 1 [Characodon lateralis]|uniref:MAD2 mitotic arrest deficient-like 1 n=1 Tax=Characodon lateralis TaxID=208331 RepID=A0ABU7D0S6_9TELE|nr:MAD2 mitotic arrest deficient-like 1 [Characodon lateralis]